MNFPARVGAAIIAGLLVCGAAPAAHAVVIPTASHDRTSLPTTSQTQPSSQQEAQATSLTMPCQLSADNAQIKIAFPAEVPFEELTVTVNGQSVAPQAVHETSVSLEPPDPGGTVHLELWDDESLSGECTKTIPSDTAEPSATESEEPSTAPTPAPSVSVPGTSPPVSPTPTPTPSTSKPTPSTSSSKFPSPTFSASSQSSSPTASTSPLSPVPPRRSEDITQHSPARPPSTSHQQPEPSTPRIIRPFSNDPRYLMPQLLGLPAPSGSELFMPRPRSAEQGPPDLETLPPVSEEELEAIKARLAAPDRADRPAGNPVASADQRIAAQSSPWMWIVPGLVVVAGLGAATFWLLKRRQHKL